MAPDTTVPQLRKNIGWNYIGGIANLGSLLVLYPIAASAASLEAYSNWLVCFSVVQLLLVADMGMGSGIVRHMSTLVAGGSTENERARFVSVAILVFAGLGVVLGAACFAVLSTYFSITSYRLSNAQDVMFLIGVSSGSLIIGILGRASNSVLWGENRFDIERKATVAAVSVRAVGIIGCAVGGLGIQYVAVVEAIAAVLPGIVCAFIVLRRYRLRVPEAVQFVEIGRPLVGFSLRLFTGSFALVLATNTPILIAGAWLAPHDVFLTGAFVRLFQSGRMVVSWLTNPFLPLLTSAFASNNLTRFAYYSSMLASLATFGASTAALPLILAPETVLNFWLRLGSVAVESAALAFFGASIVAQVAIMSLVVEYISVGRPVAASNVQLVASAVASVGCLFGAVNGGLVGMSAGYSMPMIAVGSGCAISLWRRHCEPNVVRGAGKMLCLSVGVLLAASALRYSLPVNVYLGSAIPILMYLFGWLGGCVAIYYCQMRRGGMDVGNASREGK